MNNANEPAYAYGNPEQGGATGLTKRELAAFMTMQGLLASGSHDCEVRSIACAALLFADALLAEMEKGR